MIDTKDRSGRRVGRAVRTAPAAALASMILLASGGVPPVADAAVASGTYVMDAKHGKPTFRVRHLFTKVPGEFNDFSGTIQFDETNPENSTVEITIQAASIYTGDEKRDGHLRSADFFDVEQHPTITFKSTKVERGESKERFQVTGDLTMHGVTRPVVVDVEWTGIGPDTRGGTRLGFEARTTVNRKDFEIVWNKTLDAGGTLLGDEVEIVFPVGASKEAQS